MSEGDGIWTNSFWVHENLVGICRAVIVLVGADGGEEEKGGRSARRRREMEMGKKRAEERDVGAHTLVTEAGMLVE